MHNDNEFYPQKHWTLEMCKMHSNRNYLIHKHNICKKALVSSLALKRQCKLYQLTKYHWKTKQKEIASSWSSHATTIIKCIKLRLNLKRKSFHVVITIKKRPDSDTITINIWRHIKFLIYRNKPVKIKFRIYRLMYLCLNGNDDSFETSLCGKLHAQKSWGKEKCKHMCAYKIIYLTW